MTPTTIERLKQTDTFKLSKSKKDINIYVYCNYNKYTDEYESVLLSDSKRELSLKRGSKVIKM